MRCTRKQIYAAPAAEPVSLAEAKAQCRVDLDTDDELLAELITVAREALEEFCGRCFISQTWDYYFHRLADELRLPAAPLVSLTSVKYYDLTDTQQTLATTVYEAGYRNGMPSVRRKYQQYWPADRGGNDDVVVRAVMGYGPEPANVPSGIRHAIKMLVAHLYENREPLDPSNLPGSIVALLSPYTVRECV